MPYPVADDYPSFLTKRPDSPEAPLPSGAASYALTGGPSTRPVPMSYVRDNPDLPYWWYSLTSSVPLSPLRYTASDFFLDRANDLRGISNLYNLGDNLSREEKAFLESAYGKIVSENEEIHDLYGKMPGLFESASQTSGDYDSFMANLADNYSSMDRAYNQAVGRLGDMPPLGSYASYSYPLWNIGKNFVESYKDYYSDNGPFAQAVRDFDAADGWKDKLLGAGRLVLRTPLLAPLFNTLFTRPTELYPYDLDKNHVNEGEASSIEAFPEGIANPYLSLGTGLRGSSLLSYAWDSAVDSLNDPISRFIYNHNKFALPLNPMSREQFANHYFSDFDPNVQNNAANNREFERALYYGVDPLTDKAEHRIPRGRALWYDWLTPYTLGPGPASWGPWLAHGLADFATFPLDPGTMQEISLANRLAIGPLASLISPHIPSALAKTSEISGKMSDFQHKTWAAMETGDAQALGKRLLDDAYVKYLVGADGAVDFSGTPFSEQSFLTRAFGLDKAPNKLLARTLYANPTDAHVVYREYEPWRKWAESNIATRTGAGKALYKELPDKVLHDAAFLTLGVPTIDHMGKIANVLINGNSDDDSGYNSSSPADEYAWDNPSTYNFDNNTNRNNFLSVDDPATANAPKPSDWETFKTYRDYFKPDYTFIPYRDINGELTGRKLPIQGLKTFVPPNPSYDPGEFIFGRKPNYNKKK